MKNNSPEHHGIPISISLDENIKQQETHEYIAADKKRLLYISLLAIIIGVSISCLSKILVFLINLITNLSFYHQFSISSASPAGNSYGFFVILVPVIGGLIVGLMALYGSRAIRGHGIPEAMEQILVNKSKIRPSITYLKPISAAISIGTGGPFGAEGPIIATGGALGSTIGQLLKISSHERKILLAAGATAGMSAIFGTPVAAIFLAVELLLFEFSPSSLIPVTLACITGSAGHHLLFDAGPVFPMPLVSEPSNVALAAYSCIGILIGFLSAMVTKLVYFIEDCFEKLPVHWMWWPAIGGLVVGVVGYFAPRTLGVGYDNITDILSGKMAMQVVATLCFMKFISWAFALGSGTSGGTLAPLLTIGGATGVLLGIIIIYLFPQSGVVLPLAALIGMSAMFAGASRALLTSIVFAIEATGQSNALLPLLAACIASYLVSFLLMENTIMTEKIARKGVKTPHSYEPDLLSKISVQRIIKEKATLLNNDMTIEEARDWLLKRKEEQHDFYIVVARNGTYTGIISSSNLFNMLHSPINTVGSLVKTNAVTINNRDSLKTAAEIMAGENLDALPVVSSTENKITGIVSYKDILLTYRHQTDDRERGTAISIRRRTLKVLIHGKKRLSDFKEKKSRLSRFKE